MSLCRQRSRALLHCASSYRYLVIIVVVGLTIVLSMICAYVCITDCYVTLCDLWLVLRNLYVAI